MESPRDAQRAANLLRSLSDCPQVPVGPEEVLCRVVVATHPAGNKKSPVGVTRAGVVYELFFSSAFFAPHLAGFAISHRPGIQFCTTFVPQLSISSSTTSLRNSWALPLADSAWDSDELDETQQKELALIRAASPSAEAAYRLIQAFMQMVREHTGQQLETWLSSVEESTLPERKSFAKGIQQDKAAVLAGLTLPWSNGPLEGHVNRLKLIKRSMCGRAKLRLLRQRVLRSSPKKRRRTLARVA